MFKYGEKVIIRDGSLLDGAQGVVYRIGEQQISVLLEKEVVWHVEPGSLELVSEGPSNLPSAF